MKAKHFIPIVGLWLTDDDDFVGLSLFTSAVYGVYHTICSFAALFGAILFFVEVVFR